MILNENQLIISESCLFLNESNKAVKYLKGLGDKLNHPIEIKKSEIEHIQKSFINYFSKSLGNKNKAYNRFINKMIKKINKTFDKIKANPNESFKFSQQLGYAKEYESNFNMISRYSKLGIYSMYYNGCYVGKYYKLEFKIKMID